MWRMAACLLISLVGIVPIAAAEQVENAYPVGVAQVDITPDYPVRLSGFGFRRTPSEGVTQRIWAKALAIGDDPLVVIAVDNLGIPASMTDEVRRRLEQKEGLDPKRLAITATHTHTAPMLTDVAPTLFGQPIPPEHQERIDRYTRELTDHLEQVAIAALQNRQPARLFWGVGQVTFAINRRTAGGPVDHDLPVLVAKNPDGTVRAVWVSYACHCVTLSHNEISGDWAGYAQEMIQRSHPGSIALVSIGCGADANPDSGVTGDKVEVAASQGDQIAREVRRLLEEKALKPLSGTLQAQLATITLAFDTLPPREHWEQLAQRDDAVGYHARVQLARLDRGEPLQTQLEYPIQTWTWGDELAFVFLPGEVVVDYSLRLKSELDGQRLWINAYANDAPCYIPSERVLREGGYEGGGAMIYYDRPTQLAAGLEDQIIHEVRRQLGAKFERQPGAEDASDADQQNPLTPEQSLARIRTHEDLVVELVASEPLVVDPVAISFGPDGRLWVCEMHDYPAGLEGNYEQPGGRVKVLTDQDGDGRYDAAQTFLDKIPFPTGVTLWRDGVLICAAPDILFARDTNGDGVADERRVLLTGFATHNYQARVNSLEYGLDHWLHGSGGLFGGEIRTPEGSVVQDLTNRDFRLDPDTAAIEAASGRAQQGRVRDDWGNWFGCNNSNLLIHYPIPDHYLRRNPHLAAPAVEVSAAAGSDSGQLYPIAETQRFELSGPPNRVTAACGLGIYRDVLLGKEYYGNTFTCEPVNLVVHRRVLETDGATYSGQRAPSEQNREFLASTDRWFRPVQVRTGPDGALWIVDMYRFVIEHPRWIPEETLAGLDVRAGANRGRIYRVYRRDQLPRSVPDLTKLTPEELAAQLESPNGTLRDLVQQLLVWQAEASVAPALEELVVNTHPLPARPATRLQALCTLDGLQALPNEVLQVAIRDEHPGVRRHALRLAEARLDHEPALVEELRMRLSDPDPQVRLQLAFSLGAWHDRQSGIELAKLALQHPTDDYLRVAVVSSLHSDNALAAIQHCATAAQPQSGDLALYLVRQAAALLTADELEQLIQLLVEPADSRMEAWRLEAVAAALQVARQRGAGQLAQPAAVAAMVQAAYNVLPDMGQDERLRVAAARLLGEQAWRDFLAATLLAETLVPQNPASVQSVSVEMLGQLEDPRVAKLLIEQSAQLSPALRSRALDALLQRASWSQLLLDRIESGTFDFAGLDATRRQQLLEHPSEPIRTRAASLLQQSAQSEREAALGTYQAAVHMSGDPARGRSHFEKACSGCHRLDNLGHPIGPDLAALTDRSKSALLQAMLDPSRAIDGRYLNYIAVTSDGRIFQGMLTAETATTITLAGPEGRQHVLRRSELDELRNTGKSLMPDGLEKDLSLQDVADLLEYLAQAR